MIRVPKLVSCIMPTNRGPEFVESRLAEIENQRFLYPDVEVVLVMDGVDFELSKTYDLDIKIIKLPECSNSVSIPRAIGITHSRGQYIAPTDDDIVILPNKILDLVTALKFYESITLAYGNMLTVKDGKTTHVRNPTWNATSWGVDGSQYIYRKSVYERIPLVFCRRACDWETARKIGAQHAFQHIDSTVSIYHWHKDNRSLDPTTQTRVIQPSKFKEYFNMDGFTADFSDV